jgi:FKBP-type peptidyl-prolyl cis-trans isomerase FkpA
MNRRFVGLVCGGVVAFAVSGCGKTAPVNDAGGSPISAERTSAQGLAAEPGPQDPDAPTEFTTTESGLKYRVLRKGSDRQPAPSNHVVVNYKGWLDDGTVFDASYGGDPLRFDVMGAGERPQVIRGWNEGITYVGEGGMIELEIPSDLAYGSDGAPPVIPADATLHFIVELMEVH